MSRESNLAKNTFILAIGTFLPKFVAFITLPILTAYLTKDEYGTYDLVTVLVSLVLPVATLQIQTAGFRFLIDKRNDREEAKRIVTNIIIFIVPVSIITLIVLFFILPGSKSVRLIICLYFFADITVNGVRQIARGLSKNKEFSISAIVSAFCKMILAFILVKMLGFGMIGAVIALALSSTVSLFVISIRINILSYVDFSLLSKQLLKEMIAYSWPVVPNQMSMWVMRVSDRFVVTSFMGLAANAVYSVANKIPSLLTLAQNTFSMAWQESASIVSKDDDVEAYYSSMFKATIDIMAGFLGLLICSTPILFKLLIRGDYEDAYYQMPILFLSMFFYCQSSFLGGVYMAYKDSKSVGLTTIAAAICNLVVDIATIKLIGLYAASGSTLISYFLLFIFRMKDIKKHVNIKYDIKHVVVVVCLLILECSLCFAHSFYLNIVNLFLGIVIFLVLNLNLIKGILKRVKRKQSN